LTDDSQSHAHRPRAVAPPRPAGPHRPSTPRKPAPRKPQPPDETPTRPARPDGPPPRHAIRGVPAALHLLPALRHPIGHTLPVDAIGPAPAPPRPQAPAPPRTPPTRAKPLLRVDLPPILGASVRISPRPQVRVRIGTGQQP
jgi:hypothetical protein